MVKEYEDTDQGPRCVYYRDDDGDSGCGYNPEIAFWYGPRGMEPDEPEEWMDANAYFDEMAKRPDPFDLMCERRYD